MINSPKLIFSVLGVLIVWLLLDRPDLRLEINSIIFAFLVFQLYAVIWQRELFRAFNSDYFTYGMFIRAIYFFLLIISFTGSAITIYKYRISEIQHARLPSFIWAFMLICVLLTITLPLLAPRGIESVPKSDERRDFENPSKSQ
jgi:hypothetical protein